jgi:hypothetical protein
VTRITSSEEDRSVKRLGIALALGGLALATALAGPARSASAARPLNLASLKLPALRPLTPPHGDYEIEAIDAYVMPGTPTDLWLAVMIAEGPGFLGGSPTEVELGCAVAHNFSIDSTGEIDYTSADEMEVAADTTTPPPSYLSGYAHLSGPDLSETTTNNAYSAAFLGAQDSATDLYGSGAAGVFPGYVQGSVSTYGWMHSAITSLGSAGPPVVPGTAPLLPDSGKMVISLRGVVAHLPVAPPGTGTITFSTGAMQCQIGGHTSYPIQDFIGSPFVAPVLTPLYVAGD